MLLLSDVLREGNNCNMTESWAIAWSVLQSIITCVMLLFKVYCICCDDTIVMILTAITPGKKNPPPFDNKNSCTTHINWTVLFKMNKCGKLV